MKNILFVCTGNTCRSPMAEGLFRRMVNGRADYKVGSAGVGASNGTPVSSHTARLLRDIGVDTSSWRSRQLTARLAEEATHVVAMTKDHMDYVEEYFPEAKGKTYLVSEFSPDDALRDGDVLDPIGMSPQAYLETRDQLQALLPSLLLYIDQTAKLAPDPFSSSSMTQASTIEPASITSASPASASPSSTSTIAVGADHGGLTLKNAVVAHLKAAGHQVEDVGTFGTESVDYPDYAEEVCARVLDGRAQDGVLVCTSGIGMCISANRHIGIQAALVSDAEDAAITREHNNANVLCLSGKHMNGESVKPILEAFFNTPFAGGRHARRVAKMNAVGVNPALVATDPEIATAIASEQKRQQNNIELIASENFASAAVRAAQGSILTNKYAEGYPGKRWYGGCEFVDQVEQLTIDRLRKIFGAKFANVQPHSGSQANAAVYFSVLQHGDKILTMDLSHGGHLTHGHPANFSGKFYHVQHYGVERETGRIDYDELERAAKEFQPKMITAGASAYSRTIDFERMAAIAKSVGAYLFVDMAHIAGLVAGGVHPSPIPHADFVTSTTHKSLRGPRGGIIMTNNPDLAKKVNAMVFPGIQGGPLMHVIAAKAVCFHEALQPSFKEYQQQVVKNAAALADSLTALGYTILSGGTDNHVMMVDLRPQGMNGAEASQVLDHAGITVNKNTIPYDTGSPMKPSGIRLGSPAVTTRGMKEKEMAQIASLLDRALKNRQDPAKLEQIRAEVEVLNKDFPLP